MRKKHHVAVAVAVAGYPDFLRCSGFQRHIIPNSPTSHKFWLARAARLTYLNATRPAAAAAAAAATGCGTVRSHCSRRRSFSAASKAAAASGRKRSLALSVHFLHPGLGMKRHEILARATAFLLSVDPPAGAGAGAGAAACAAASAAAPAPAGAEEAPPPPTEAERLLRAAGRSRASRRLADHYLPTPAGGKARPPSELGWLEFCPPEHRPRAHCVAAGHVLGPWRWEKYYPQDWLRQVGPEHCRYSLDVYDAAEGEGGDGGGGGASLARFALAPHVIHHPGGTDLALLHLRNEDAALMQMEALGVEVLHLRDDEVPFEKGEGVTFEGFRVAEDADGRVAEEEMGGGGGGGGNGGGGGGGGDDDDTRSFHPFEEPGSLIMASPDRFLAETGRPLPEGLCGGPVLDGEGSVAGVVEGIVPLDHADGRIAGAAAFLPAPLVGGFVEWAEREMLQRILPEGLFGKVERLRAGEALNEGRGPIRPSAAAATTEGGAGEGRGRSPAQILTDDGRSAMEAYDDLVGALSSSGDHTTREVEAILATIERERGEVLDLLQTEGGDLDEVIARVRRRTREEQGRIVEEARLAMMEEAEVVEKDRPGGGGGSGGMKAG